MMRAWIAVALLAASWLFGLGYLDPVNQVAWACTLAAAVLLLSDTPLRMPQQRQRLAALALLIPAVWITPFPYNGGAILLLLGFALSLTPTSSRWLSRTARGAALAGTLLIPQAFALLAYQIRTARGHEVPTNLAQGLAALARLLGADATADSTFVVVRNAATTVHIAATWELLFAPATVCFLAGGCALLAVLALQRRSVLRSNYRGLLNQLMILVLLCAAWAPLRAMLLVTVVMHQQMRATPIDYPNMGETLISTWIHVALVLTLSVLAGQWLHAFPTTATHAATKRRRSLRSPSPSALRQWCAVSACGLGVAILTFLYFWVPVGQRRDGRIMVVERHSAWEPTTEPYGTSVYGEAGSYNYAAIYGYCEQYYDMSRLLDDDAIDDATLSECDVLIIKTPTARYSPEEVEAVEQFVHNGGSLMMIGDHTNVFNMNTYLNDISRRFGFTFRNDLLFRIGDPYCQAYRPPATRHPMLQYLGPMNFAVSCSIDPGNNRGTMAIRNTGLYNLPPAYHESNYHPQAEYRPNMQYGSWCQLWSTTHGEGRIAAFADSTLFSNFCVFQPGKAELFVGMLEWLNHHSALDPPWAKRTLTLPLVLVSLALVLLSMWWLRRLRAGWLLLLASGTAAWAVGSYSAAQWHRHSLPLPAKHSSIPHVVIDRTISTVPLFTGAFADDRKGNGYGLLEQWIPRIGNYISRRRGEDAFRGDGLVLICPTETPSPTYLTRLDEWVHAGGQLVVFDSPDVKSSTADSILTLFGLDSISTAPKPEGEETPVQMTDASAETPLLMSLAISGGDPIARWGSTTVAARVAVGEGSVTAIGFGSLFNDAAMGNHWLNEPNEALLRRYAMLYALLRAGLQN